MGFYFGIDSSYASGFFSGSFSSNSSKHSASSGVDFSSLYTSLGDYGSIRNGSYSKLISSYYTKVAASDNSNTTTNGSTTDTGSKLIASNAASLKSAADSLGNIEYKEENRKKITSLAEDFVSNYNSLIKSSSNTSSSISKKINSLKNLTNVNATVLKKVGISVNSDSTLSIDSDTLGKTDLSYLKAMFSGKYSYAAQVSSSASSIYSSTTGNSASAYTSTGSIQSISTGSILDTLC